MNNSKPNTGTFVLLAAIMAAFFLGWHLDEKEADRQDSAALQSREAAGRWVCGADTPVWINDKTIECVRESVDVVAGVKP
ncbi:hypothetical protein AVMA1855_16770 [Acidovorax sp. SUPP1855]|uniref:hypothetical protein n=1 Tax=Acidovorax sp. SUPP1855 TaxID=431774 RepID=UPI0023DE5BF7|nr:hypothetical protein [Acidovorax sp. SUPP1855]GKS85828.1 hypothetical protein AVMA1855_16770 [Acidovorax sp. SUPP1855]